MDVQYIMMIVLNVYSAQMINNIIQMKVYVVIMVPIQLTVIMIKVHVMVQVQIVKYGNIIMKVIHMNVLIV